MKSITYPTISEVVAMPRRDLPSESLECKLGWFGTPPSNLSGRAVASIQDRLSTLKTNLKERDLDLEWVGYRSPLTNPQWVLAVDGFDWIEIPISQDRIRIEGIQMPRNIQKVIGASEDLFDDLYIAHALPIMVGRTVTSPIPWDDLGSPTTRRIMSSIESATYIDRQIALGFLGLFRGVSTVTKTIVAIALVTVVAVLILIATISLIIASVVCQR